MDEKLDNFSKIVQAEEIVEIAPKLLRIINNLGFRVIRVLMIEGSSKTLQFMIERADLSDITIKECSKLSRVISEILEERELIQDRYNLEVSSPGLERPIIEYSDFKRFIGSEVKIKLKDQYKKKRTIENILYKYFPKKFIPRYNMVSFTSIPYSEIYKKDKKQNNIIDKIGIDNFKIDLVEKYFKN